jgi:predicted transcriptional regulator
VDEVRLHPALLEREELEEGHAVVRFACALVLHAFEIATGLEEGPFGQERAEQLARVLLMPEEEFLAVAGEGDIELAERFGVPIEQVAARRMELTPGRTGSVPPPD